MEERFYGIEEEEEFYDEASVEGLSEDDEISVAEEGFMIGYMEL